MELPFSVLISVYHKENPAYFKLALESIIHQTLLPNEIVIVEDGPLGDKLNEVIADFKTAFSTHCKVIRSEKNQGLGVALQIGLNHCSHDLVARMDTDDISHPERFKKQLTYFKKNDVKLAVVGSTVAEFESSINNITGYRDLPTDPLKLVKFAKSRNPLNHMSVLFRKSIIEEAGGYIAFLGFEDYYLWARVLQKNYLIKNISEPLVYARVNGMHKKRVGLSYLKDECKLQYRFYQIGHISFIRMLVNILIRNTPRLLPTNILKIFYKYFLRKRNNNIITN